MKVIPDIPVVFEKFPLNYVNDVNGWSFDKTIIDKNKGKLLTLDIDYGSNCSLNCPYCFRKKNSVDSVVHELKYEKLVDLIHQAKKLGLRSVKFLGAGEPLENFGFLNILRFLKKQNIIPLIFTKGHVIGNDKKVSKYFGEYGIFTGKDLVKELNNCNASILLSFNSFDNKIQSKLSGSNAKYTYYRNRALKLMVEEGFNKIIPTRLALINSPITIWTINEALEIYKWGRLRNLYTVITTSMISGKAKNDMWKKITPKENKLIELYLEIYKFNIETNLQSFNQIIEEGISAYAGCHPCNQVSTGLYVTLNGKVLSCPGSETFVEGNIWENSLKEIWLSSSNFKRSGTFNCYCNAKAEKSLPINFYSKIFNSLILWKKKR
ncbi:MAG: radical SAM protein [Ignavibacteriae bacterium]|nr:radical SAM protein [Ignavibacteriota bacterium]